MIGDMDEQTSIFNEFEIVTLAKIQYWRMCTLLDKLATVHAIHKSLCIYQMQLDVIVLPLLKNIESAWIFVWTKGVQQHYVEIKFKSITYNTFNILKRIQSLDKDEETLENIHRIMYIEYIVESNCFILL